MSLALFDLDETLISGDCSSLWSAFMVSQGWVKNEEVFLQRDTALMQQYARGEMDMQEYMNYTLEPLKGHTQHRVAHSVQHFIHDVIAPRVYKDARDCLAHHRAKGDRLVIISASGEHLVAPIAQYLGVNETLAIGIGIENGVFTGTTQGVMTFREGKVTRLMTLINQDMAQLQDASFYSDSHNDLPLLLKVGHPNVVNPDPILQQHARRQGWPVFAWS
ncbi:HAD family hydrolase [Citrobacter sp. JGM124]|uniref:HAD family hydrolase n=1 Tax=Citrobacter sp. JGM124 TaxID=2799789 RepID=UPI001BA93F5A|nr:HAD family hydrolase [Citrobacter sp. JGM124]MBS0848668.1 HAD family hydrolase [Citrobacter sp. JGM124]